MQYQNLPPVRKDARVELAHFPSALYAAVFRLWECVPAERIAYALDLDTGLINQAAAEMGLPSQKVNPDWMTRGYITVIRNAWHVLPYENLLRLLGWSKGQLASVLKEDDFFGEKLGGYKPYCAPIETCELDEGQKAQLSRIRALTEQHFAGLFDGAQPFDFFHAQKKQTAAVKATDDLR
ncbi:MAG: hypothetical protein J6V39_01480, partial [Clostridia bacterium]|nr:hypothetical protein [Clostridia bacterium]